MAGLIALFLNPSGDFAWAKNGRGQWAGMTPADSLSLIPPCRSNAYDTFRRPIQLVANYSGQLRSARVWAAERGLPFSRLQFEVARPLRLAAEFSPQTNSAACLLHSCSEESAAGRGLHFGARRNLIGLAASQSSPTPEKLLLGARISYPSATTSRCIPRRFNFGRSFSPLRLGGRPPTGPRQNASVAQARLSPAGTRWRTTSTSRSAGDCHYGRLPLSGISG